ncbi:hypothetical protein RN001_007539 [Aquatica leii]|uniref:MADF domain-containing protein n=1 Tax=Aquatica leii TaxID=1421715 RepID=A0AAN7QID5_9COLE|nr:hypothetical protein RN001_007539 [Aquatica leii]
MQDLEEYQCICPGSWIKIFSVKNDKFWLVLVGQSIVALSAVFLVSAPAAIAATWFGSTEVSLACSVGLNGVLIGVAIGCLIPSFAVSAEDDFEQNLYIMLLTIATIATVVLILQFFFFADKPRYAPSKAQLKQLLIKHETTQFFKSIFRLIKKLPYLFHLVGFGVTYGISCSIIGLLNQFVSSYYENAAVDAGRIGVVLIVMGIVGSVSCGILLDKFNRYKVTYLVLQCGYIVAMLVFTYTLEKGISIIYITAGLIGLFMGSVQPVASEAAIEFTYPESEGVKKSIENQDSQDGNVEGGVNLEKTSQSTENVNDQDGNESELLVNNNVTECKVKWNSVHSSYVRYLIGKTLSGSGSLKRKKWYVAYYMMFLKDFVGQHRQSVGNAIIEDSETSVGLDQKSSISNNNDTTFIASDGTQVSVPMSRPKVPKMAFVVQAVAAPMI